MKRLAMALSLSLAAAGQARAFNPNFKYFGYWLSGGPVNGVQSYMADTAGYTNLVMITDADVEADAARVFGEAHKTGRKVIVNIEGFVRIGYHDLKSGTTDGPEKWRAFAAKFRPYQADIGAFLISDEPTTGDNPWNQDDPIAPWPQVQALFETWKKTFKTSFPNVPLYINWTAEFSQNPPAYLIQTELVSFDDYGCWDKCASGGTFADEVATVEQNFPHSQIILLPYSTRPPSSAEQQPIPLVELADKYADLARSDRRIVGMLPWTWWTTAFGTGARDRSMGAVRDEFAKIGKSVIEGGAGTICVTANTKDGYFTTGPDTTWGWNGSKCFQSRPSGAYTVGAPGASVSPERAALNAGQTITFEVTFGGSAPPTEPVEPTPPTVPPSAGAPTLSAIRPASFTNDQAMTVAFRGSDFQPGAEIQYQTDTDHGQLPARFVSSEELRLDLPPGTTPGAYTVSIKNADGTVSGMMRVTVRGAGASAQSSGQR
jgi:hypothetical protein